MYPLRLDIGRQDEYSRLLPLVKWLLLIPHMIALLLVAIVAWFAIFVSFFAVVVTGRYPRRLFDFVVGVYRWGYRAIAYGLLMTDRYPPFSLADDPDHPVRFDVVYPEDGVSRWRPLVHWLLIIPYHFVAALIVYVVYAVVFLAFFTILFGKRFPRGMFDLGLNGLRWSARSNAYFLWLVTEYPPFEWDPDDGSSAPPASQPANAL
ncbi:DUF4389 domain-containing protein [soil metagenome]